VSEVGLGSDAAAGQAASATTARLRFVPDNPILRRLGFVTLVNTFGDGLFMTIGVLYFTRIVGLPVGEVGLGLTIAGGFGIAAGVVAGKAADRWAPKPLMITLLTAQALGMLVYPVISSLWLFLGMVSIVAFMDRSVSTVRSALTARVVSGAERVQGKAFQQAVGNFGIGAGSAVAAIALQADTRTAYVSLILVDAATFLVAALIIATIPMRYGSPAKPDPGAPPLRSPWRDRRYLTFIGLNSLIYLQFCLLEVGVPLWVVRQTNAPRYLVSVILIINTALVVLAQMRASRGMEDQQRAARGLRRSGFLLACACLAYACSHGLPAAPAALVLIVAAVVQTLGELLGSAAGFALSFELADPAAPGAYLGATSSGTSAALMLGPVVITSSVIRFGAPGWIVLAALFAVVGAVAVPALRPATPPRTR
jgi:MFS family permease